MSGLFAILGAAPASYRAYGDEIRREYAWVPREVYARRRAEVLGDFRRRDPLYQTSFFRRRLERRAKQNLTPRAH